MLKQSIFDTKSLPELPKINGVSISVGSVPIKKWSAENKEDFTVLRFDEPVSVAGVYTQNLFTGPNIKHCREALKSGKASVLVIIAGNANVANGDVGLSDVAEVVESFSEKFDCPKEQVFLLCTGTIGLPLPMEQIRPYIANINKYSTDSSQWLRAANAMKTTDTYAKTSTKTITILGKKVTINGICKGSGMIHPNMATTLSCIVTDANISSSAAQLVLSDAVEISFNCVCLDDTSTSDAMMLFATNAVDHKLIENANSEGFEEFRKAIREITIDLARMVARDAEGIGRFITINVTGAKSFESARKIGKTIADSLLFKSSASGGIHNIAKVAMAVGNAGEPVNISRVRVSYNGVLAMANGTVDDEERNRFLADHRIADKEIEITVDVAVGIANATVWTCDLNVDYIYVNTVM